MRIAITCLLLSVVGLNPAQADDSEFAGAWSVTIQIPAQALEARLELEHTDEGWIAWVEGGPAPVTIENGHIDLYIDSRDRQGYRFQRRLLGTLQDGVMSGTMESIDVLESAAEFGEDGSKWSAHRFVAKAPEFRITDTSQLAGIWAPLRGFDLRKWTTDLTPAAKDWLAGYDSRMDEPQKRCINPGLYAAVTWSFPFEIVASEEKLVLLYEAFNLQRRVFTDNRDMPDFFPNSGMGYSTGRLDDGEFVIETILLTHTIRDFNGEPISENARIVERYRLSDDGNRLSVVLTLHDPENYNRPSIRRRMWTRQDDAVIFPFECDPDSFFRQLYNEGRMQEYIDRTPRRP